MRKSQSVLPLRAYLDTGEKQRRKGMDGGIHVAEVPLIGRDLAVGMEVGLAEHQLELLFGEIGIHGRKRDRMERQIPGCVPGILPFVRHRDDVVVDHVEPIAIAGYTFVFPVQGMGVVFLQPLVCVEVVVLFGPEHPRERLADEVGAVAIPLVHCRRVRAS